MRTLLTIIAMLTLSPVAMADEWDNFVDYLVSHVEDDGGNIEGELEQLEQLHLNPLNINDCSYQDLGEIGLLTPEQAEAVCFYVARAKGMKSLNELDYIQAIDSDTRRWLPLFVYAGEYSEGRRRMRPKDGKHELTTRIDIPLYKRKGYTEGQEDGRYQGSRIAHSLKYRYKLGNRLSAGITIDKDQGEPVGGPFELGYDFVGGHVMLKNLGWLQALVAGDYQLGFGQGLLINQRFAIGKQMQAANATRSIAAKSSAAEFYYMRGVAATAGMGGGVSLTAFFSYNLIDATLQSGTKQASSLSTVSTHRTRNEISKRHNTSETVAGAHAEWKGRHCQLGATGFYSRYHLPFSRSTEAYRRYYPAGNTFYGLSADYGFRKNVWTVAGETATDGNGVATLNRISFRPSLDFHAQASYRYYSPRYHSFHSQALSEWGVQNETGCYIAVEGNPCRELQLSLSADFFRSPYLRYGTNHPTSGQEVRAEAQYKANASHTLHLRASWKHKERNDVPYVSQRYQVKWNAACRHLSVATALQLTHYSNARGVRSLGYAVQETARWQDARDRVRLALSAAWFSTQGYDSRIYLSEPTTIGSMPFTMLYGDGIRLAGTFRVNMPHGIILVARYTLSRYLDRETIGNGKQQIPSPYQNDISLQMQLRI